MSDDENDDKLTAGENKINICQINEMITCKVGPCFKIQTSILHFNLLPTDLLWLPGRRHYSNRMPPHLLQGALNNPTLDNIWPTIIPLWATSGRPPSNVY